MVIDLSTDRSGIFAGDDPFALAADWMRHAQSTEPNDPNAISLATVDSEGRPNVRIVLLKEIEADAFVFYTNYSSTKGQELDSSGFAAFSLYWKTTGRQVRVRGKVEREDGAQADSYYNSRGYESRIGAYASRQSEPLTSRHELQLKLDMLRQDAPEVVGRPKFWGGYRVYPFEFEFWANGEHRLHDRFRWVWDGSSKSWEITRLNP